MIVTVTLLAQGVRLSLWVTNRGVGLEDSWGLVYGCNIEVYRLWIQRAVQSFRYVEIARNAEGR